MISVSDIRVFTLELDAVSITWRIDDTVEDLTGYVVSLWRSESMVGPYQQVSQELDPIAVDNFRDTSVNLLALRRAHIYRVRVRRLADDVAVFFGSRDPRLVLQGEDPLGVPLEAIPDLRAAESTRRFDLVAREYAGRKMLHLRRRTTGQFCPSCYEPLTRRQIRTDCSVCWGTMRAGGFYAPQQTWPVEAPPKDDQGQLTSLFEVEKNDIVVRVSAYVRVGPRDLFIKATGERYDVQGVKTFHKGSAGTWCFVHLRQLEGNDFKRRLPVQWDVDSKTAGPVREYVRATDIDSFRKAVAAHGLENEPLGSKEFPTTPTSESG